MKNAVRSKWKTAGRLPLGLASLAVLVVTLSISPALAAPPMIELARKVSDDNQFGLKWYRHRIYQIEQDVHERTHITPRLPAEPELTADGLVINVEWPDYSEASRIYLGEVTSDNASQKYSELVAMITADAELRARSQAIVSANANSTFSAANPETYQVTSQKGQAGAALGVGQYVYYAAWVSLPGIPAISQSNVKLQFLRVMLSSAGTFSAPNGAPGSSQVLKLSVSLVSEDITVPFNDLRFTIRFNGVELSPQLQLTPGGEAQLRFDLNAFSFNLLQEFAIAKKVRMVVNEVIASVVRMSDTTNGTNNATVFGGKAQLSVGLIIGDRLYVGVGSVLKGSLGKDIPEKGMYIGSRRSADAFSTVRWTLNPNVVLQGQVDYKVGDQDPYDVQPNGLSITGGAIVTF